MKVCISQMKLVVLLLLLLNFLFVATASGQMNLSGKPGLIYIPSAREIPDGTFTIGYTYNPIGYSLRRRGNNPERILYCNLTFLPRISVGVQLLQLIGTDSSPVREGIGDRQMDLQYLLFIEKPKRPSIALIVSSPFTVDAAMVTYAVVASKKIEVYKAVVAEVTVGYGSPYYVYRDESVNNQFSFLANYRLQKKSEDKYKNNYLAGPFGGVCFSLNQKGGMLVEWDSQMVNVGGYVKLFEKWTIQGGVLNFDQITFGTSYTLSLASLPSKLRKKHAKE